MTEKTVDWGEKNHTNTHNLNGRLCTVYISHFFLNNVAILCIEIEFYSNLYYRHIITGSVDMEGKRSYYLE